MKINRTLVPLAFYRTLNVEGYISIPKGTIIIPMTEIKVEKIVFDPPGGYGEEHMYQTMQGFLTPFGFLYLVRRELYQSPIWTLIEEL